MINKKKIILLLLLVSFVILVSGCTGTSLGELEGEKISELKSEGGKVLKELNNSKFDLIIEVEEKNSTVMYSYTNEEGYKIIKKEKYPSENVMIKNQHTLMNQSIVTLKEDKIYFFIHEKYVKVKNLSEEK